MIRLIPVSNLIPISVLRQDRYLYLPSIAVIVAVSIWLEIWGQGQRKTFLVNSIIAGVVFFLGSLSFLHTFVYASEHAFWQRVANQHSQKAYAQVEAGYHCKLIEDEVCEEKRYRHALAIDPEHANALNNLGILMMKHKKFKEAQVLLDKAIRLDPTDAVVYGNRILLAEKSGVGRENIPEWKKKAEMFKQIKKGKDLLLGDFRFR